MVEFSTEVNQKKVERKLFIPSRVAKEVEGKVPIIMIYQGIKLSNMNKEYHDLFFVEVERTVKSRGKEQEVEVISNELEDARASFSDEGKDMWAPPQCSETDICNEGLNVCYAYCFLCRNHMPYNGSQCRCAM